MAKTAPPKKPARAPKPATPTKPPEKAAKERAAAPAAPPAKKAPRPAPKAAGRKGPVSDAELLERIAAAEAHCAEADRLRKAARSEARDRKEEYELAVQELRALCRARARGERERDLPLIAAAETAAADRDWRSVPLADLRIGGLKIDLAPAWVKVLQDNDLETAGQLFDWVDVAKCPLTGIHGLGEAGAAAVGEAMAVFRSALRQREEAAAPSANGHATPVWGHTPLADLGDDGITAKDVPLLAAAGLKTLGDLDAFLAAGKPLADVFAGDQAAEIGLRLAYRRVMDRLGAAVQAPAPAAAAEVEATDAPGKPTEDR